VSSMRSYHWQRTKIVCTLGPSVDSESQIGRLMDAGMDVVRLNLAHGTLVEHAARIRRVRRAAAQRQRSVAILADLPGPKLRIGRLAGGSALLKERSVVALRVASVEGDATHLPVGSAVLLARSRRGESVRLADGTVRLEVMAVRRSEVICRVVAGGVIRSGSGLSVPSHWNRLRVPTADDRRAIAFAVAQGVDWIGVSFVRSARELLTVRRRVGTVNLLAKVETPEALERLEAIVLAADGVMIARGDLGVETPPAEVPFVQKRIIETCLRLQRPVITATQMLESMVEHPSPTRAEVTDIANAVLDGTDAVMLSAETSIGRFPVAAVRVLREVITASEQQFPYAHYVSRRPVLSAGPISDAVSWAACRLALEGAARAMVVMTGSGLTAQRVAALRPEAPIVALTRARRVAQRLRLVWGVQPLVASQPLMSDACVGQGVRWLRDRGLVRRGDHVVLVTGQIASRHGETNAIGVRLVT